MSSTEPLMKRSSSLESYGTGTHHSITILESRHVAQLTLTFETVKWQTVAQYCLMHVHCVPLLHTTTLDIFCQRVLLSVTFYFIWVTQCLFQTLEFSLRQSFDSHEVQLSLSYEQFGVTNPRHKHAEIEMYVQSLSVATVHFLAIYNVRPRGKQMLSYE
jgi:hypothetical protein